jgi:hypothetical protein
MNATRRLKLVVNMTTSWIRSTPILSSHDITLHVPLVRRAEPSQRYMHLSRSYMHTQHWRDVQVMRQRCTRYPQPSTLTCHIDAIWNMKFFQHKIGDTCNVPRNVVNHVTWWITNSYHPTSKIDCLITTRLNTSKLKLNIPDISTLILSKFFLCAPPLSKAYTSFYVIKPNFLY